MKDLDLGPESRELIRQYERIAHDTELAADIAAQMAVLLRRWTDDSWCWIDAAPARICGGPHVKVTYRADTIGSNFPTTEVIEQVDQIGETFKDVPYTVSRS